MRLMKSMDIPTSRTIGNCGRKGSRLHSLGMEGHFSWILYWYQSHDKGFSYTITKMQIVSLSAMRVETITDRLTNQDFIWLLIDENSPCTVVLRNSWKSAHPPLWQTCKVHRLWALLTTKERPRHVYDDSKPLKQIIWHKVMYNGITSGFEV